MVNRRMKHDNIERNVHTGCKFAEDVVVRGLQHK